VIHEVEHGYREHGGSVGGHLEQLKTSVPSAAKSPICAEELVIGFLVRLGEWRGAPALQIDAATVA
jgi:hypothetical protein